MSACRLEKRKEWYNMLVNVKDEVGAELKHG